MRVVVRDRQARPTAGRARLRAVADIVCSRLDAAPAAVGVAWVGDAEMSLLHGRFRGVTSTTDVLSFPSDDESPEPGEDLPYWGDVVVCTDQAARQAAALGHSYELELVVLVLHGLLHLRGLDHTGDGGEMTRLEESLRPRCMAGAGAWV